MPSIIDLSMMGLQGQQAFADRQQTLAQTALLKESARKQDLENDQAERLSALNDLASKRLRDIVQGKARSNTDPTDVAERMESLADPIEAMASIYATGGAPEKASELFNTASEIRKRESDIDAEKYKSEQVRLENIVKGSQIVGQWLGGARNESEWRLGLRRVREAVSNKAFVLEPELLEQLENMPYDEDAAAYFAEQSISAGEKAKLDLERMQYERQLNQDKITNRQAQARLDLDTARHEETVRHNRAVEKASGGKSASTVPANSDQMRSVKNSLLNSVFKDAEIDPDTDADFNGAADYIASQAVQMVKDNKGLTWNLAVNRAILQAETAGMFKTEGPLFRFMGIEVGGDDKPKFAPRGKAPDNPLQLPQKKNQLVRGQYYMTARGTAMWNGSEFESVDISE